MRYCGADLVACVAQVGSVCLFEAGFGQTDLAASKFNAWTSCTSRSSVEESTGRLNNVIGIRIYGPLLPPGRWCHQF